MALTPLKRHRQVYISTLYWGEYEHIQDVQALSRVGGWAAVSSKNRKSSRRAHSAYYPLSSLWCEAIVCAWMRKTLVDVRVSQRDPSHTFRRLSSCIPPTDPGLSGDPAFLSVSFFPTPSHLGTALAAILCLRPSVPTHPHGATLFKTFLCDIIQYMTWCHFAYRLIYLS